MALDLEKFVKLRPYLYHLTARSNIPYIQKEMMLKPSNILYAESGELGFRGTCRRGPRQLRNGRLLRDQDRLHAGNIKFSGGWIFVNFITHLDDHVFFWPGTELGPVPSGRRHFERYAQERPIILRITMTDLLTANRGTSPLFCKYNSGAPRCSYGSKSPRGPDTFLPAETFSFAPTDANEVTFKSPVKLPSSVQAACYPSGSWKTLNTL
jgi:hypothetical protein